jgi:hypothetical protein
MPLKVTNVEGLKPKSDRKPKNVLYGREWETETNAKNAVEYRMRDRKERREPKCDFIKHPKASDEPAGSRLQHLLFKRLDLLHVRITDHSPRLVVVFATTHHAWRYPSDRYLAVRYTAIILPLRDTVLPCATPTTSLTRSTLTLGGLDRPHRTSVRRLANDSRETFLVPRVVF